VTDAKFDRLVPNVYKVLLTRGMVSTVIYSTDTETRDALRLLVHQRASNSVNRVADATAPGGQRARS
jgi:hypothetical protein